MGRRFKNRFGEVDNVRKFVQRNGNLAAESDGTKYTYDVFNRLAETDQPDGTWQKNIYDAAGLRMATAENGTYTEYTFDRGSIIADYSKDEDRTTRYIRGYDLISQEDGKGGISYYLHNAHGDVTKLVDSTGNIQNSYSYDAFGNTITYTEKVENRFRYAGEQYDAVTGQIYLRARYYEPEVGRFTQEDAYRGDGLNLYVYVNNNPVKYVDPSGYCKDNVKEAEAIDVNDTWEYFIEPFDKGSSKIIIDGSEYKDGTSSKVRERIFAFKHPFATADIGTVVHGSNNISTVAVRFATNRLGLTENDAHEGSQVNAFRHALWQSMITSEYGVSIATGAGNSHEEHPDALDYIAGYAGALYSNLSLADEACDLLNNQIGRNIGKQYEDATSNDLALTTLEYYHDYGLWVAVEQPDGLYEINRQKLTDDEYETAHNRLITLDEYGYGPDDEKPIRGPVL